MAFGVTLAMTCAVATAAEVWDSKPFPQWSDKELEKVLTDSPWAGKATITHARKGANLGSVPDWKIVVAIRSALPLKQAIVRGEIGTGGTPSAQHQALLTSVEPVYRVSISGIPRNFAPQLQAVADAAVLKPKGKAPIAATQGSAMLFDREGRPVSRLTPSGMQAQIVRVGQRGGGGRGGGEIGGRGGEVADNSGVTATLVLGFPRDTPITAQDQEFDFMTVIGAYNVKRTFKLKDMLFKGELAL
jgi:hypothetical protein